MQVINTRYFGRFWPVLWTITHHFGVPEQFLWLLNPKLRLRIVHQHSPFWPILTRFMDYYTPFWGKEQFSWLLNPEVRLCVGHSGPFHGLLHTILARFVDYYTPFWGPGAIYMVAEA
mgnify:CR=1 FL=1